MAVLAQHRAMVWRETIFVALINGLIPSAIIWAVKISPPASLGGPASLWSYIARQTGMATLGMTIGITLAVRGRLRRNRTTRANLAALYPPIQWLPIWLPLRGLALAVLAIAVFVPLAGLASLASHLLPLSRGGFFVFNVIFGVFLALTITPLIILRALADTPQA